MGVILVFTSCKTKEKETDGTNVITPTISPTNEVQEDHENPLITPYLPFISNLLPGLPGKVDVTTGGAITPEIIPSIGQEEEWLVGDEEEEVPEEVYPQMPEDEEASHIFGDETKAYLDDQGTIASIRITNRQITITKILKVTTEHLVIPAMIDDMNVVAIGNHAFSDVKVQTVELEEGIRTIETQAFYGNSSLLKISIPKSITKIGNNAFGNCMNLSVINLAEENENYKLSNGVLYNKEMTVLIKYPSGRLDETCLVQEGVISIDAGAFSMSRNLAYVFLPNSLRSIGTEAFAGCILLNVDLPEKLIELNSYAFANCYSMREIIIPAGVSSIGEGAFSGCETAKKLIVKGSVKEIGYAAFSNCSSLTEVKFSHTVEVFSGMSFAFCTSLQKMVIPEGTKELSDMVFYGCNKLTEIELSSTINYFGTMIFEDTDNIVVKAPRGTSAADYAQTNGLIYQES